MDYDTAVSVLNEHKRLIERCGETSWLSKERKAAVEALNAHFRWECFTRWYTGLLTHFGRKATIAMR
jgi:hypothetical protein